ncbi:MAG: pilus assembly protein N-terminal domain-containing protein [Pseudomonadota bacterium]
MKRHASLKATIAAVLVGSATIAGLSAQAGEGRTGAQGPVYGSKDTACGGVYEGETCLTVLIDHLRPIKLEDEAKTLLIGNPAIADVNMVARDHAVVTARSVGSTNVLVLDQDGETVGDFQIVVRAPDSRRVVVRRGSGVTENYQCAPRCERSLSPIDSAEAFGVQAGTVATDWKKNDGALGEGDQAPAAAEE